VKIPSGCKASAFVKRVREELSEEYLELVEPLLVMLDAIGGRSGRWTSSWKSWRLGAIRKRNA
jgi:hypothetical protein